MEKSTKKTRGAPRSVSVLGLPYALLGVEEAAQYIETRAVRGGRFAVFTPGATVAALAERDRTVRALLRSADLLLVDGCGIS